MTLLKNITDIKSYLIFVICCTPPHFLVGKLYARKVRFAIKNCLATKQRESILGVLAVLVGVLAILVGVFGVLCIGMVYLLHENLGWCTWYFH